MHGNITTADQNQMTADLKAMMEQAKGQIWELEVQLEAMMLDAGADNFRAMAERSTKRGQAANLEPYRKLVATFIRPMARQIEEWRRECAALKKMRPMAYNFTLGLEADTLALLTLRSVLGAVGRKQGDFVPLLVIAHSIGAQVQQEARMVAWKEQNPKLWGAVQHRLKAQHSTSVHHRRVNINRFNMVARDTISWTDWPDTAVKHVGLAMVEALIKATGQFELSERRTKITDKHGSVVLTADPAMTDKLAKAMGVEEFRHPVYMPTVVPPAAWSNMRDGGYHSELARGLQMIRFRADNQEQRLVAIRELGHVDMPDVYDALNLVQQVPWRINQRVFDVARTVHDKDMAIGGMTGQTLGTKPPRPAEADNDEEIHKAWKREATKWYGKMPTQVAGIRRDAEILRIADIYAELTFYFPHKLDFRGRMYPIPAHLQPQGHDLARGLLIFAEGKPVTEDNAHWLAIQVANTWGMDKVPYAERIKWVEDNRELWLAIDADPLAHREWASSGHDCWQLLAAIFEWAQYLREGPGFVSRLPIRVDGTCNGIQHLSAMVLDAEGGASVNLVPSDRPHDIYAEIADLCQIQLERLRDAGGAWGAMAGYWLEALAGKLPRTLTKRPVMILPYGGTLSSYREYTKEWIEEYHPDQFGAADKKARNGHISFISNVMWHEVGQRLVKSRAVQKWLQECAAAAAETGLALRWSTPSGFVCRHFYGARKLYRVKTLIDGQRFDMADWRVTAKLDVDDQLRGIPPNFVHSMDASVLTTTIVTAYDYGITNVTCIHDAYGTLAADMDMLNECLRAAFIWTYKQPVLEQFRQECAKVIDDNAELLAKLPEPLPMGDLDLDAIADSLYFFA